MTLDLYRVCVHEAGHAVVVFYLLNQPIDLVEIFREGDNVTGGRVSPTPKNAGTFERVAIILGGILAEQMVFNNFLLISDSNEARVLKQNEKNIHILGPFFGRLRQHILILAQELMEKRRMTGREIIELFINHELPVPMAIKGIYYDNRHITTANKTPGPGNIKWDCF